MRGIFSLCFPALMLLGSAATAATSLPEIKLTAADGKANEAFGWSVAISGTTAIVGAVGDRDGGDRGGAAYLFDTRTGAQIGKLAADDDTDSFVESVAVSGDTAIISTFSRDGVTGSVSVFDVASGTRTTRLTAGDTVNDVFGAAVAISGGTAIVGAFGDDAHGINSGAAYLFDSGTGEKLARLTANDPADGNTFGWSVAISGNTAIVGGIGDSHQGAYAGSAYLFDSSTGEQIAKLTAEDSAAFAYFGISVAISGNTAIVGAFGDQEKGISAGAAYLFDTTTGAQIAKLTAEDGWASGYFGYSVAISGGLAVVGAPFDRVAGVYSGSAYVFDIATGAQIAKVGPSDGLYFDQFGHSVALSGTNLIVGAFAQDDGTGAAYLYDLSSLVAPAPVPLPAGIWLLGSALGLGAFAARRRNA